MLQKPTKIFVVACMNRNSKTGVTTYYNLIKEYITDFAVEIITPADAPWVIRKLGSLYLKIFNFLIPKQKAFLLLKYFNLMIGRALKRKVNENKDVIFHAQDPISAFAIQQIFRRSKIISTCHYNDNPVEELANVFSLDSESRRKLQVRFDSYFKTPSYFIFVSRYVKSKSSPFIPFSTKGKVIHNGVDFEKIKKLRQPKRVDKLIITNCGTLESRKNQRLLIELAKELTLAKFDNFEIWLIGQGKNYNCYNDEIQKYNLSKHVILLGYVENPWYVISKSHVYIHTAINESFGYVILEAIAAGTFTVAVSAGGVPEILGNEYCVPLAQALAFFKDLILTWNLSVFEEKARWQFSSAKEKFDIKHWSKELSDVYKWVN